MGKRRAGESDGGVIIWVVVLALCWQVWNLEAELKKHRDNEEIIHNKIWDDIDRAKRGR